MPKRQAQPNSSSESSSDNESKPDTIKPKPGPKKPDNGDECTTCTKLNKGCIEKHIM